MMAWARAAMLKTAVNAAHAGSSRFHHMTFARRRYGFLKYHSQKYCVCSAMPMAGLEVVALGHRASLLIGEGDAVPSIIRPDISGSADSPEPET